MRERERASELEIGTFPHAPLGQAVEADPLSGDRWTDRMMGTGTHWGVVDAEAVRQAWLWVQAAPQREGLATAAAWGCKVGWGSFGCTAASPGAPPALGLLTRQAAGWEQAL